MPRFVDDINKIDDTLNRAARQQQSGERSIKSAEENLASRHRIRDAQLKVQQESQEITSQVQEQNAFIRNVVNTGLNLANAGTRVGLQLRNNRNAAARSNIYDGLTEDLSEKVQGGKEKLKKMYREGANYKDIDRAAKKLIGDVRSIENQADVDAQEYTSGPRERARASSIVRNMALKNVLGVQAESYKLQADAQKRMVDKVESSIRTKSLADRKFSLKDAAPELNMLLDNGIDKDLAEDTILRNIYIPRLENYAYHNNPKGIIDVLNQKDAKRDTVLTATERRQWKHMADRMMKTTDPKDMANKYFKAIQAGHESITPEEGDNLSIPPDQRRAMNAGLGIIQNKIKAFKSQLYSGGKVNIDELANEIGEYAKGFKGTSKKLFAYRVKETMLKPLAKKDKSQIYDEVTEETGSQPESMANLHSMGLNKGKNMEELEKAIESVKNPDEAAFFNENVTSNPKMYGGQKEVYASQLAWFAKNAQSEKAKGNAGAMLLKMKYDLDTNDTFRIGSENLSKSNLSGANFGSILSNVPTGHRQVIEDSLNREANAGWRVFKDTPAYSEELHAHYVEQDVDGDPSDKDVADEQAKAKRDFDRGKRQKIGEALKEKWRGKTTVLGFVDVQNGGVLMAESSHGFRLRLDKQTLTDKFDVRPEEAASTIGKNMDKFFEARSQTPIGYDESTTTWIESRQRPGDPDSIRYKLRPIGGDRYGVTYVDRVGNRFDARVQRGEDISEPLEFDIYSIFHTNPITGE